MDKLYLGVDIGGMSIKAGVVDNNGRILSKETVPTRAEMSPAVIIEDIYKLCLATLEKGGFKKEHIAGVGMGSPGTVNSEKGIITFSGNLNFKNVNIVKEFKKLWNVPVIVGNDANCAALGEARFGAGQNKKDCLMITLGTGVGTGFIIGGKILEGKDGEGAEGGHITIKIGGEKCSCGERGCWEAYASAKALVNQTKKAMEKCPESLMNKIAEEAGKVSGRTAFTAYKEGDKAAEKVVKDYIKYVGTGLITLINIFRPEVVIIGGGVSHEGEYFIKMVEKYVKKHVFGGKINKIPEISGAFLGNDAGIIGAAALILS